MQINDLTSQIHTADRCSNFPSDGFLTLVHTKQHNFIKDLFKLDFSHQINQYLCNSIVSYTVSKIFFFKF